VISILQYSSNRDDLTYLVVEIKMAFAVPPSGV